MNDVQSADGTTIAFDQSGEGPALILVAGALQYRAFDQGTQQLAALLAPHFTVINYDRRGRDESSDTQPFTVEREIEDVEALIDMAGGSAFVYGISSDAALAFEAVLALGGKIKKLAMYEAPYNADQAARQAWVIIESNFKEVLSAGRRGDALALFMECPLNMFRECAKTRYGRSLNQSGTHLPTMLPPWGKKPTSPSRKPPTLPCLRSS